MYKATISHVHIKVRELERAIKFYSEILNFTLVERNDEYAFLTGGEKHHELSLRNMGKKAAIADKKATGLYHSAFEVPDQTSLVEAYQKLKELGVNVRLIDHVISWAMYFNDPDENGVEIFWDTRSTSHGAKLWQGQNLPLTEERLFGRSN